MNKPKKKNMERWSLVAACHNYIEYLASDGHDDGLDDYENDIFEKAVEYIYGEDVWKWIRKQML